MEVFDSIVIGGGQAGLASGYHLKRKGLKFIILESQAQAAGSWPRYYESLKLFSPARVSSLPGMKFPSAPNRYPLRNEVIQYFKQYKAHFNLPVKTNQHIDRVTREGQLFAIHTNEGNKFLAKTLINATGSFHSPYKPQIPGQDTFRGEMLHSSDYRRPEAFAGKRVLVVGRGNSAVKIAVELAEKSHTSLAVLKPVQFTKQRVLGIDLHLWVRAIGFDTFPFWRFGKNAPNPSSVVDLDQYQLKLKARKPDQRQMFTAFYEDGVIWPDGKKEAVDAVIFATGYRPTLNHLNELGATDSKGAPIQRAGVSETVPGLYYVGLYGQRSFASATIRGVGPDANFVVKKLKKYLSKR
ncbi:NAD(P)/FAD-dependent oxidoreductase [Cohnella sp. REN36]|uniref:flavin-containing monooxygenase n=1 Tax=Cohnella sp. REN36 TaxID=2887347 RepID=UPI001D156B99|nr:NAD(P)/FAD-dependent oxidoreductase [Cohnella sp. REN36]MCC3373070.1 NAD(P)/FAD-dependent oxidoreductase [Cohnella sp. REN36]